MVGRDPERTDFPLGVNVNISSIDQHPSSQLQHSLVHMGSLVTPTAPDEYRLPTNVKPVHYDVTIKTDLENQSFEGFVCIK